MPEKQLKDEKETTSGSIERFLSGVAASFLALGAQEVQLARNFSINSSISNRLMFLIICLFGVINYSAYNAELISILMSENYEISINELISF